jgi:hypothetical protein
MEVVHENTSEEGLKARRAARRRMDILRSRVKMLTGVDRVLMEMYLGNGNTFHQMAQLTGTNESSMARRIRRIIKRLVDGIYISCLRNHELFTNAELEIARDFFLMGLSQISIPEARGCSMYQVRKTVIKVRRIFRAEKGI